MVLKREKLVEVWFGIEKDADGYPESQDWEDLWCSLSHGKHKVESVPFFVRGISRGDVVRVEEGGRRRVFRGIISRSDHSTYRLWVSKRMARKVPEILDDLRKLGCKCEVTLERLVAVDVPHERVAAARKYMVRGLKQRKWEVQEACIR